jgi:long-chain acyl-CoA synthetase
MQEFCAPVIHIVKPDDNVTDDVFTHEKNRPDAVGFKRKVNGAWTPVTWREFAGQVRGLAAGFIAAGIQPGRPALALRLQYALFDRLVYAKLCAAFGGQVHYSWSAAAPLSTRLGHFFRGCGITILEGYGLTETSPATNSNTPDAQKIGTVGQPVPGCTIRIAEDGEVLVKGPMVFQGYWNNPVATKEMIDADGWLHTGDLGALDDEGFLTITGRKKDLIITASGKNVAPAVLEDRVRAHWLVSQCLVVGDARPYIGALVTLDPEAFAQWKADHGKPPTAAMADLRGDPALRAEIQAAIDDANKAVSHAEAIKKFAILDEDFTEAGDKLTPTGKLRRHIIMEQSAAQIAALYDDRASLAALCQVPVRRRRASGRLRAPGRALITRSANPNTESV